MRDCLPVSPTTRAPRLRIGSNEAPADTEGTSTNQTIRMHNQTAPRILCMASRLKDQWNEKQSTTGRSARIMHDGIALELKPGRFTWEWGMGP